MGGFASILGGALAGAGAGIAEKGKLDLAQRHAQAMETLRSGQRKEEATHQGQINENLSAGHDKRQADSQMALQNDNQEFQGNVGAASAQAQKERDEANHAHEERIERIRGANKIAQIQASGQLAKDLEKGTVYDFRQDPNNGKYYAFYKDGSVSEIKGIKIAPPPPKASGAANDRPLTRYGSGGAPSGTNTGVVTFDPKTGRFSDEEN